MFVGSREFQFPGNGQLAPLTALLHYPCEWATSLPGSVPTNSRSPWMVPWRPAAFRWSSSPMAAVAHPCCIEA